MPDVVAIRADGNSEIGFGHITRTQALARQLCKQGAKVIFLTRNPENIKEFDCVSLSGTMSTSAEDDFIARFLPEQGCNIFIIDSYAYDQDRLNRAGKARCKSVYIDDLNRYAYDLDVVINGNLYASRLDYRGRARFLLGSDYLLMRETFRDIAPRKVSPCPQNILLSFGAADPGNITPRILGQIIPWPLFYNFHWHVVIGPAFRNQKEIARAAEGHGNISLYHNPDIKTLMDFADIAISAAGSTVYELAASGVPSILLVAADNQVLLASEAERRGIAINGGPASGLDSRLLAVLDELAGNMAKRQNMASTGQNIIDGRGAERVAGILLSG